jgi:DNA invertase Pin-like site-specific DNA recombinase
MSEKVKAQHIARKAMLYVRQSSAYQVTHNLESQKLQYAMQDRLRQLGWREIEVVDEDLGRSAAGMVTRTGFERMVSEVCLGKVGAVAAREVSRFARNSREWQQLMEVCRIVDTVLVDQDMVYAPRQSNDRLLLGLKGSLNEYELDLLRQRSVEARYAKARRGALLQAVPVGYVKTEDQRLEKDPDRRVQQAIALVFRKFAELGTVRQTLWWFLEHGVELPTHTPRGATYWRRPSYRTVYRLLTSPVYGGAYAYGKTEQRVRYEHGTPHRSSHRKPREQWLTLIPHAHEGYVPWEEFEQIRQAITANNLRPDAVGAAKKGAALLAGLLRCRRCGRKLTVRYTGSAHDVLRYACLRGLLDHGEPRCVAFGGIPVDDAIAGEVLRVVQPAAVEAALVASEQAARQQDEVVAALQRDLEAARYAALRAQRQYDATDPENRLVAGELEQRWNLTLQRVQELEARIASHTAGRGPEPPPPTREAFAELATRLEAIWHDPGTDVRLKKRIVRTLLQEVLVDVDSTAGMITLVLHWAGGVHTELRVPRRRRGQHSNQTPPAIVDAIASLARICPDKLIAGILNRNGLQTGQGNRWTQERVTALRSHHQIACYNRETRVAQGWLNLTEAAAVVGLSPRTLRLAVERGESPAEHPLPEGPWIFQQTTLGTDAVKALVQRAQHGKPPAIPLDRQRAFAFSGT